MERRGYQCGSRLGVLDEERHLGSILVSSGTSRVILNDKNFTYPKLKKRLISFHNLTYTFTMAQQYDSISKHIIRGYSQAIARLVLGNQNVEVEEDLATEKIAIQVNHSDVNFKVKHPDGTKGILHIEVQTHDSREPMEARMAAYHGLMIKEYKCPVYGCVIY